MFLTSFNVGCVSNRIIINSGLGHLALWLKADLRSKCEFLNTSHLLIEGYILEIGHGKTEYSLTIYLTTKKISATSERAHAHRSQKRTCAAVFSRARLFSHSNMHCRDYAWKDKILNDHLSDNNKKIQPHRGVTVRTILHLQYI